MHSAMRFLFGLALALVAAGCSCGEALHERSMTPQEAAWAGQLQKWYPGWQAPYLSPVQGRSKVVPAGDAPDIETVPATDADFTPPRAVSPTDAAAAPRK